jgi:uncharacterized protein YfiM (DUF2279 family)
MTPARPGLAALAGRFAAALALSTTTLASASCGYRSVYAKVGSERLHVALVRVLVPEGVVADDVAAGMQEELARAGALAAGDGYPRAEIEVLRTDAAGAGIAAAGGPGTAAAASETLRHTPQARATTLGVSARAWVVAEAGATPSRDTGDVWARDDVAFDLAGAGVDLRGVAFRDEDALRAAARRLGRKLASKLIGDPAASEDDVDPQ